MLKILITLLSLSSMVLAEEYLARVTYYWPGSGGQVGYQTATGKRAVCGQSIAVDPRIIPYGSRVRIPQMGVTARAVDTGSAVKARTASRKLGKNNIVIDVFCSSAAVARARIKRYPMFMKVIVEK